MHLNLLLLLINQFVYANLIITKPTGQSITIRQKKKLESLVTPLTINSGSNKPELTYVSTTNGIDTYTITSTVFLNHFQQTHLMK